MRIRDKQFGKGLFGTLIHHSERKVNMKNMGKKMMALILTAIIASGTVVSADVNSDIKSAKNAAIAARDAVAKYETNLTTLNSQRKDVNEKLTKYKSTMESKRKTYTSVTKNTSSSSSEFRKMRQRRTILG